MPSLDFDTEKAWFRDYYKSNRQLLDDATNSFNALITSLINHVGRRHCFEMRGTCEGKRGMY